MSKRIAIVTGASGGIGREFTRLMCEEGLDEIWVIARSADKLTALKETLGEKVRVMPGDLTDVSEIRKIEQTLMEEKPELVYLVNNAGMLKMGNAVEDFSVEEISAMVDLNSKSMALMCKVCRPFLQAGSKIINVASSSAFLPLPYLNIYAASKSFARNYSRALNVELKGTGITATAVCPGWVDTPLAPSSFNGKKMNLMGVVQPKPVAEKALKAAKKGKDIFVYPFSFKGMHLMAKLFPQRIAMAIWKWTIRKHL